jgi:hypothetical protein
MEAVVWRKVRRVGYEEKLREYPWHTCYFY